MKVNLRETLAIVALLSGSAAFADPVKFSGHVGAEFGGFPQDGLYPGQLSFGQASFSFGLDAKWRSDDRNTQAKLSLFARVDASDNNRSHYDVREAYIRHQFGEIAVLAGVNKVFWGVTESRHLVDIVNQIDTLEYTDSDARLGQPMLMLSTDQPWGSLLAMVMTGFRAQEFPGAKGRLRFALPVDHGATTWGDSAEEWAPDFALRYYRPLGDVDLGLSVFYGTSREPIFRLNDTGTALNPHYSRIWQASLDMQYTNDALLLKLEAIARGSDEFDTFGAAVAGLEYTVFQLGSGDSDLGLIGEYLYDGRGANTPVTIQQNDIFVGARWAANDTQDTSALIGALVDLDDGTTLVRAEFERRLSNGLSLELRAQALINTSPANPVYGQRRDNYLFIGLSKHF